MVAGISQPGGQHQRRAAGPVGVSLGHAADRAAWLGGGIYFAVYSRMRPYRYRLV